MLGSPIIADDNHAEDRARATEGPEKGVDVAPEQSSYLSQISQIIFVEKNCHVEKFWEILEKFWEMLGYFGRFCNNLRTFMWRKIDKKYICGEKMTNIRSGQKSICFRK